MTVSFPRGLFALFAVGTIIVPLATRAEVPARSTLPTYDFARYCAKLAVLSGRDWDRQVCLKKEATAKEDAALDWRVLTARVRETCDHYASQAGGSYYILASCLTHYIGTSKARMEQIPAVSARNRP